MVQFQHRTAIHGIAPAIAGIGGGNFAVVELYRAGTAVKAQELTVNADRFYLSSADANVWYDGSTLWTYIKDAGEVNVSTPTADELGNINPYAILRHWQDNFRHKLRGTAAGYTIVELTPLHPSDYESLTIYVDGGHNIRKLTVVFDEANLSDITISGLKRSVKVDNSMFAFDRTKHPNVDIIDLR